MTESPLKNSNELREAIIANLGGEYLAALDCLLADNARLKELETSVLKKAEMLRLCRLLDVKDWDKNEQIAQEVQSIIQKEEKVKNKDTSRSKNEKRKTQKKRKKIKSQKAKETNEA